MRNLRPDAPAIASKTISGTNKSKIYLLGDLGFLKCKKADAEISNMKLQKEEYQIIDSSVSYLVFIFSVLENTNPS